MSGPLGLRIQNPARAVREAARREERERPCLALPPEQGPVRKARGLGHGVERAPDQVGLASGAGHDFGEAVDAQPRVNIPVSIQLEPSFLVAVVSGEQDAAEEDQADDPCLEAEPPLGAERLVGADFNGEDGHGVSVRVPDRRVPSEPASARVAIGSVVRGGARHGASDLGMRGGVVRITGPDLLAGIADRVEREPPGSGGASQDENEDSSHVGVGLAGGDERGKQRQGLRALRIHA